MVLPLDSRAAPAGRARLEVALVSGQSAVISAYASSPLKLLTPRSRAESVWAYTSSFGGGLVGGDQTELDLSIRAGARCFVSTQATTKVYRNSACLPCTHRTRATVEPGAFLMFAPDLVQPFARSTYRQDQEWQLHQGAGLVLLDWFCSGRAARGERWHFRRYQSRNDVYLAGERVWIDSLRLDEAAGPLSSPFRVGRFDCFAMLLLIGAPCQTAATSLLATVGSKPVLRGSKLVRSASPVREGALLRIAGESSEEVRDELAQTLKLFNPILGDDPWERKW